MQPEYNNIYIQELHSEWLQQKNISLQVLRLDAIHPVISGNKIFKLHYFTDNNNKKVLTFGGAYSNHLVATAYSCQLNNVGCIGIVRGERPTQLSHTLQQCIEYGTQLYFISREAYNKKDDPHFIEQLRQQYGDCIIIPEGGYSPAGAKGASLISKWISDDITHICCAVGTATTIAGLLLNVKPQQQVVAFPVLKGMIDITQRILFLTGKQYDAAQLQIESNYHFGGYAKRTTELIDFMNNLYRQYQLPADFVYTGKMMYGVMDLIEKDFFLPGSKICCIHTGGLQGNLSLPVGTLTF